MKIDGKRALITGASSGIGKALAWELARRGALLALAARRTWALDELADAIAREGYPRPATIGADLSQPGAAAELARKATLALGGIDLLVNNAGVGIGGAQTLVGDDAMARELFETNFWSPLALTRALVPEMRARGEGAVVNVSSIGAFTPFPLTGHYGSSKAALSLHSDVLRTELRGSGVRVLLVVPGPVATPLLEELKEVPGVPLDLMPRGTPEQLARLVAKALQRERKVVVYPRSLAVARHFPTFAAMVARLFARRVDVSDPRAIRGGSSGDEVARAARARHKAA
jgi:short-subunit dehydrogenase